MPPPPLNVAYAPAYTLPFAAAYTPAPPPPPTLRENALEQRVSEEKKMIMHKAYMRRLLVVGNYASKVAAPSVRLEFVPR